MTFTLYDIFGFSLSGAILVIMALGIVFSVFTPTLDKWGKKFFITLFSLLFLFTVTCFVALILWYDPTKAAESSVVYFFEDLFLSPMVFMPTVFLLHSAGEEFKKSLPAKIMIALLGVYLVITVVSQFTEAFYYVTDDNQFVRGPLWAVALAPLGAILILNIIGTVKRQKKLSKKYFIALLVYLIPMTAAIIVHMFINVEIFVISCMALFALIMYGLILSDNVDQFMRQQQEIAHQKASIMVLQMRPHFIYNSMMGIYYLCDQNPKLAQQVTLDFTTYLRKNFAAIASEETIPFAEELEHTRAYLAVEQAQFEDSLFVKFDTPYTHFRIPPLTLQPIVENAVVHCMRASNDPIHVSVATRKTDREIEIIIEDDGPGFKPSDNNEPHIALNNIRFRLKMMCDGELLISTRPSGGTSVKVLVPAVSLSPRFCADLLKNPREYGIMIPKDRNLRGFTMAPEKQATDLPGYRKKSFLLYYNGGEIWFEHLEGMYENEDLVIEKLNFDVPSFTKPSSTSFICFVFFDTVITDDIILAVAKAVLGSKKRFNKIAFCGLDRKSQKKFKKALMDHGFGLAFFDGLEDAKVWLLP